MRYLLDSNVIIGVLRGHAGVLTRLREHVPASCVTSAIVMHELFYGAFKSRRVAENLARVDALRFEVLALDREDSRCAGEIRASLAAAGQSIGPYDVLIAGQALARGMTLVTHNCREFDRVTDLKVEDWEVP